MRDYEFAVVIERDEDGRYLAICPALQGCYTEGETEAEARALIEDARASFEAIQKLEAPGFDQVFKNKQLRKEFENLTRKLGPTS